MHFATCEKNRALEFIRKFYEVEEEKVPLLMGLIKRDVLRVTDPSMHPPCEIVGGSKCTRAFRAEIDQAIQEFQKNAKKLVK